MGCDYYIQPFLKLTHVLLGEVSYIELPIIRGYFCEEEGGYDDDDEDGGQEWYSNMVAFMLTPRKEYTIYTNNSYVSENIRDKYHSLVDRRMQKKQWTDMTHIHITKIEVRYERGNTPKNFYLYFEDADDRNEV